MEPRSGSVGSTVLTTMNVVLALAVGIAAARFSYPWWLERRARRLRPLGPDGIIVGAGPLTLDRSDAPAVLLLHGSGDTPQVLAQLAAHLHENGYAVRVPLLLAHGRSIRAFTRASSTAWHEQVEREYVDLLASHPAVYVVGLSMGGALAVVLATRHPEMPALVLLAPYLDMSARLRRLARLNRYWGWLLPYVPSLGKRSIHDRAAAARGLGHQLMTPASLRGLYDVMLTASAALPEVRVPTLVMQSREDNRIPAARAARAFDRLGSAGKEMVWVEGAGHVITVDYGHERVFDRVLDWLRAHGKRKGPADATGLSTSARQS